MSDHMARHGTHGDVVWGSCCRSSCAFRVLSGIENVSRCFKISKADGRSMSLETLC